ncbi:flagellar biosynthetic protein FliO [Legionella worsleiensis]|nr:flagellar biosynthetic protein FliO [Legionella worsleiensis]
MRHRILCVLMFWMHPVLANQPLVFKKDLMTNHHWPSYTLIVSALFGILLWIYQYLGKTKNTNSQFKIIEQLAVHHKTKIYVIDYQGQQFLLADNQNTLSLIPFQGTKSHHE